MTRVRSVESDMTGMSISRKIPERCEVKGRVGKGGNVTLCSFTPKRAVSVEGLSPVFCCNEHGKEMSRFWGTVYDVTNEAC